MASEERNLQVAHALTEALAAGWSRRHETPTTVEPAEVTSRSGWSVALRPEDGRGGALIVWFDEVSAASWVRRLLKVGADPQDHQITAALGQVVTDAVATLPALESVTWSEPEVTAAEQPASALAVVLAQADARLPVAVLADIEDPPAVEPAEPEADASARAPGKGTRLQTVLDVDLPLVVRFGRAIMPLRSVADLGPGSVIDMGRSPDEPVELLIGERLIARGEVVVVGGNYGVRITELTDAQSTGATMEATAS